MDRRPLYWALLATVLISVVWGTTGWAKSRFFRRVSATQSTAQPPASHPIQWHTDLRTAHRLSASTGQPMLIVFGASWCTYCKKLEAETLGHPTLANYINTEFIPVHLDFEKDRRVAQVLEVTSLPTCVVLSPQADLLGTVEGFVRPREFAKTMQHAVNYQRTLEAERAAAQR